MPNHFTTIGIFSPGYEFDADDFNERHAKTDFCALIRPMPEPLEDICVGYMADGTRHWRQNEDGTKTPVDVSQVQAQFGQPDWYEWAKENWGTKWGTYDAKAFQLGGDGSPVIIKFQSAWGPPSILNEIGAWLCKAYKFEKFKWIGFDPYDDSVSFIED